MSDININLDGVLTFLVAAGLGLLLVLGLLISVSVSLIRARRNHEPFVRQRLFSQIVGMLVSLSCCAALVALLVYADSSPAPRTIGIWLDKWLWAWLLTVVALWPISTLSWKKWHRRLPVARQGER